MEEPIQREQVKDLMLDDYERVIFYLLSKRGLDVEEINVVMKNGVDINEFKIKRPFTATAGSVITSHVHRIEYVSQI
jgi:hypothetical protein